MNLEQHVRSQQKEKRRKKMIFRLICSLIVLAIVAAIGFILWCCLRINKSGQPGPYADKRKEYVYEETEIEEVSLDDISEDVPQKSKDEQYLQDISESMPAEVVESAKEALSEQEIGYIENDIQITDEFIEDNGWLILDIGLSKELQIFTQETCQLYQVPYPVVLALMESESTFRSDIGNEQILGGEEGGPRYYGYMQLSWDNCEKAKTYALDAHTPEGNIEMGILLLSGYLEDYNGDVTNAIMAYKGGKGAADSWIASGYVLPSAEKVATRAEYYDLELQDFIMKIEGE